MPAETRLSIRQQIVDAIRDRLNAIRQANDYATDVGSHCFIFRDLQNSPFTPSELADGGAINITDSVCDRESGVLNVHDHSLAVTIQAASVSSGGFAPPEHARRIESDLLSAVGRDRQWEVDGVKLAKDTLPGPSRIGSGQIGDRVAWVELTITVKFRTQRFDPYTQ